jgi:hypothetical protein
VITPAAIVDHIDPSFDCALPYFPRIRNAHTRKKPGRSIIFARRPLQNVVNSRAAVDALTARSQTLSVSVARPRAGSGETPVSEDQIGYDVLTQEATRGVVKAALMRCVGGRGLPGRHHFYITFRTHAPGVLIPEHLTARYPEEMTIVLEHQFWDLEVFPDRFRVILKFGGQPYPLTIPFLAISRFYDPSVRFGLQFDQSGEDLFGGRPATETVIAPPLPEAEEPTPAAAAGAPVVSLDAFRKK